MCAFSCTGHASGEKHADVLKYQAIAFSSLKGLRNIFPADELFDLKPGSFIPLRGEFKPLSQKSPFLASPRLLPSAWGKHACGSNKILFSISAFIKIYIIDKITGRNKQSLIKSGHEKYVQMKDSTKAGIRIPRRNILLLMLVMVIGGITSARATDYTYSTTLNVSSGGPGNDNKTYGIVFPAGTPSFTLSPGDSLSGTISFDQAFQISDPNESDYQDLYFSLGGNATYWATVSLTGVQGDMLAPDPQTNSASGSVLLIYTPSTDSNGFEFSGFNYSVTADSGTSLTFTPGSVTLEAETPISIVDVPEPPIGLLMAAGLVACGIRLMRPCSSLFTR